MEGWQIAMIIFASAIGGAILLAVGTLTGLVIAAARQVYKESKKTDGGDISK